MKNNIISIGAVILFLATLSVIKFVPAKSILYPALLFLLGMYLFIDLFLNTRVENSVYRYKLTIITLIIFLTVVLPCLHRIFLRHHSKSYEFAHDGGVIQTEEAMKYFLNGKNPYSEDYYQTALDQYYTVYKLEDIKDSTIRHYTYLPLTFLLPAPVYVLSKAVIGWFDVRFIYLPAFLLSLYILPRLAVGVRNKELLLITFTLNPFLTPFIATGRNDVFLLFWMILIVLFLILDKPRAASMFLGFACVTKPTAWLLIPFFGIYLLKQNTEAGSLTQKISFLIRQAYPLALIFFIFIFPFLVWDFTSFWEDVFRWDERYPMGGTPGFGFASLLQYAGFSKEDYFPFKYLQLLLGLPLLYLLVKRQLKNNTVNIMLVNYAIFSLLLLYFSRFLHDNYIGYAFSILCLGVFAEEKGRSISEV